MTSENRSSEYRVLAMGAATFPGRRTPPRENAARTHRAYACGPYGLLLLALTACAGISCGGPTKCSTPFCAKPPVTATELPWKFGNIDGVELDTRHYRIFTTTSNRVVLDNLPAFMEQPG